MRGEDTEYFTLDRVRVYIEQGREGSERREATVAVFVDGHRELAVGEGVGPVDALSNALNSALSRFFPRLDRLRLSDYKVRVLNPGDATAAVVRVLIEHHTAGGEHTWHTVGVSKNIIEASWQALVDGIRYYLLHTQPAAKLAHAVA